MAKTYTRNGQPLGLLPDGHKRRYADGKNAWTKMSDEQKERFLLEVVLTTPDARELVNRCLHQKANDNE